MQRGIKLLYLKKRNLNLNKNNEYRDRIEYKTLTITCDTD